MKKSVFSLVLVLLLGLTACTKVVPESGTANVPSSSEKADINSTDVNSTADSSKSESSESEIAETIEVYAPLDIRVNTLGKNYVDDDYDYLLESEIDTVLLSESDSLKYPELNKALGALKTDFETTRDDFYDRNLAEALEFGDAKYSYTDNVSISRNDGKSLALMYSGYEYLGGAHGYYWSYGYNFDVKSGKRLEITDVVKDIKGFYDAVEGILDSEYADDLYDNYKEMYKENYEQDPTRYNWIMTHSGVDVIFTPYELAPYASGQQVVNVSFSKYPELFNDEYKADESGYIIKSGYLSDFDYNGDGKTDSIDVSYGYASEGPHEEWDEFGKWTIYVNDQPAYELKDRYFWEGSSYFIHTASGADYILLEERVENDYTIWSFVKITGGGFTLTEQVFGYSGALEYFEYGDYAKNSIYTWSEIKPAFYNPESMTLGVHTDILGTYSLSGRFRLTDEGKLEQVSDALYYNFSYLPEWGKLTAKVDVKGKEVTEDGKVLSDITIPKGNIVTYYRTDNKSWVDLKLSSGKLVRVEVKNDDWPKCINDIPVDDVFDGILWAG